MGDEPDKPLGRIGRRYEFADGIEQWFELSLCPADEGEVRLRKPSVPRSGTSGRCPTFAAGVHAAARLRWYRTQMR
jgi:hypothetical protein